MLAEMSAKFNAFLLLTLSFGLIYAQKYCNSSLCLKGKRHIGCRTTDDYASNCASNARLISITADLRSLILNQHNQYRNRIACGRLPGYDSAVRMSSMRWDSELEQLAALNVKQCAMKHDKCRNTQNFPFAGQNLAFTNWFGKEKQIQEIVLEHMTLWFDEYRDASMKIINNYKKPKGSIQIGHFTQLAQEKATHVGCAVLRQKQGSTSYQFMACNYAFTNILERPVYRRGVPAFNCTTGINKKFKCLCSIKEKYNVKSSNY